MNRDDIDTAIDQAARQLTTVDPTGSMAGRVIARLEVQPRTNRGLNWPFVLGTATAAFVLIALISQAIDGTTMPDVPRATTVKPLMPPLDARVVGTRGPAAVSIAPMQAVPRRVRRASASEVAVPAVSAAEAAWLARALPAVPVPEPLTPVSSQPEPIAIPLLELKPLSTARIQLARIGDGR